MLSRRPCLVAGRVATLACLSIATACAESPTSPARRAPLRPNASATVSPADVGCRPDDKFIGRIELSNADLPGTWWRLTKDGIDKSYPNMTSDDYLALISLWFGTEFATLDDATTAMVNGVRDLDANQNNYVCAYELRGKRVGTGDPNFTNYVFFVHDDKRAD